MELNDHLYPWVEPTYAVPNMIARILFLGSSYLAN
jgi:hypothetical protein